jgi:hypothetical protein
MEESNNLNLSKENLLRTLILDFGKTAVLLNNAIVHSDEYEKYLNYLASLMLFIPLLLKKDLTNDEQSLINSVIKCAKKYLIEVSIG